MARPPWEPRLLGGYEWHRPPYVSRMFFSCSYPFSGQRGGNSVLDGHWLFLFSSSVSSFFLIIDVPYWLNLYGYGTKTILSSIRSAFASLSYPFVLLTTKVSSHHRLQSLSTGSSQYSRCFIDSQASRCLARSQRSSSWCQSSLSCWQHCGRHGASLAGLQRQVSADRGVRRMDISGWRGCFCSRYATNRCVFESSCSFGYIVGHSEQTSICIGRWSSGESTSAGIISWECGYTERTAPSFEV